MSNVSFPTRWLLEELATANHILFDQGVVDAFEHVRADFGLFESVYPGLFV